MDQSRISKRKRSPKPRSKKTQQQSSAPPQQERVSTVTPVQEVSESLPAESQELLPESQGQEPQAPVDDHPGAGADGFEHIRCERLATTPAAPEMGGVVDIEKSFQVSCNILD
jgi:hypothetical protein